MVLLTRDGVIKEAPTGFSWTTLFFGFFPALIRGDLKWGLIILIAAAVTGISWLIFPFFYNKLYIKELLKKGYKPKDLDSSACLKEMGVYDKGFMDEVVDFEFKRKGTKDAEELKKWAELYREGAITEEEYNRKKKEILK